MAQRIKLTQADQQRFFRNVKIASGASWQELARPYRISDRTLRDWSRGLYTPDYKIFISLSRRFNIPTPPNITLLERYWYIPQAASLGGLARYEKHGAPGTVESRRKGGKISQFRRHKNPKYYGELGCKVQKVLPPLKHSGDLAELCGILLGDGGLTDGQVRVTLHRTLDAKYGKYVALVMQDVFGERPTYSERQNVLCLTLSGVELVRRLEQVGLRRGNKIIHQVRVPNWITKNKYYERACLRGLMDTDGCVYTHRHTVLNKKYKHAGLTFTNHSLPLVQAMYQGMQRCSLNVKHSGPWKIFIYNRKDVTRYFKLIGSHNPKHLGKFHRYFNLQGRRNRL
jgi:hypothetical protein